MRELRQFLVTEGYAASRLQPVVRNVFAEVECHDFGSTVRVGQQWDELMFLPMALHACYHNDDCKAVSCTLVVGEGYIERQVCALHSSGHVRLSRCVDTVFVDRTLLSPGEAEIWEMRGGATAGGCWLSNMDFKYCCSAVRSEDDIKGCWTLPGYTFDRCCVQPVLDDCEYGCDGDAAAVAAVPRSLCAAGDRFRVCDVATDGTHEGPPHIAIYTEFSSKYVVPLAYMLRSLQVAGHPVRVVLRERPDARDPQSGKYYDMSGRGARGYVAGRLNRSRYWRAVAAQHWSGRAIISDTDVEYFEGWLPTALSCLRAGADLCFAQPAGWEERSLDQVSPGFFAFQGNGRALKLFEALDDGGISETTETRLLNQYLQDHGRQAGAQDGPRWTVFHPEVAATGIGSVNIRLFGMRVMHFATKSISSEFKATAAVKLRAGVLSARRLCPAARVRGRFPAHPLCVAFGDSGDPRVVPVRLREASGWLGMDLHRFVCDYAAALDFDLPSTETRRLMADAAETLGLYAESIADIAQADNEIM